MGRFTFVFAFEFIVALPNHPAVFAGGVPHLGAEESTTVTADDTLLCVKKSIVTVF